MAQNQTWLAFAAPVLLSTLVFTAVPAKAAILYNVTVDTTGIVSGTQGNLNFQLNPGGLSQAVSADVSNFASPDGTLTGVPALTGDVTGALPGTVTFGNSTGFNDYFQGFTFGSSFSFLLTIYGPAIDAPNGTATSGTTFGIALYDAAGTTPLLTTDASGFAATVDVNLIGSLTINAFPPEPSGTPVVAFAEVPEPSTLLLTAFSLLGACCWRRRGISA